MYRKSEVIPKIFTDMVDFSCPQQPHQLNESTQLLSTREIKKKKKQKKERFNVNYQLAHLQILMLWTCDLQLDLLISASTAAFHCIGFKRYVTLEGWLFAQRLPTGAWDPRQHERCFQRRFVPWFIADACVNGRSKETVWEKLGSVLVLERWVVKRLTFQLYVMRSSW